MKTTLRLLMAMLGTASLFGATAPERCELVPGLEYLRIRSIPEDLPTENSDFANAKALVLDVRNARGTHALEAWLQFLLRPDRPSYILLNQCTAVAIAKIFSARPGPALVSLSIKGSKQDTDLEVTGEMEADVLAVERIDAGTSPSELIRIKPGKPRLDEEHLAREHSLGNRNRDEITPTQTSEEDDTKTSRLPLDPVLTRAVELHLALQLLHPAHENEAKAKSKD